MINHDSDCATNNAGVPELLGPCDCSVGEGLPPRILGLVDKLERQAEVRARTPKKSRNYLAVDSCYRHARSELLNAFKLWMKR